MQYNAFSELNEFYRVFISFQIEWMDGKTKTKNLTVKLRNNPNNISLFHVFLFDEGNNHIIILKITIHIRVFPPLRCKKFIYLMEVSCKKQTNKQTKTFNFIFPKINSKMGC